MKRMVLGLAVPLSVAGCANFNSIYRTFDVSKGESPMVDIRQRAVLVAPNETVTDGLDKDGKPNKSIQKGWRVCAEPSPDSMASLAYELAAKGGVPEKGSAELGFAMQDSAAFTGLRTQSIQLLRDFSYRLCESHLSGAITTPQYDLLMRRLQKNTVALLAIEQLTGTVKAAPIVLTSSGKAETTKSLAEQRAEREKVADQVSDLEKQKENVAKKRDEAKAKDSKVDTSSMDREIADLDGKIARSKGDLNAIDKAIANSRGVLAEGRTEVTIRSDSESRQRSDEHVRYVADTVREIVMNIVLADDERQLCLSTLQSGSNNGSQKEFAEYCIKKFKNQAEADRVYLEQLKQDLQATPASSGTAKPPAPAAPAAAPKGDAEKKREEAKRELNRLRGPNLMFRKSLEIE